MDLNRARASQICDNRNHSNLNCIAASGSLVSSDLLLLSQVTVDGIQLHKLMILSKTDKLPVSLAHDPGIMSRSQTLGTFSPVDRKVSFAVIEADQIHSSIWIRDLEKDSTRKITETSKDKYWYAYPTWNGDGTAVAYLRIERSSSGRLKSTMVKYDLEGGSTETLENGLNAINFAFSPKSSEIMAAWTSVGLELFDSKARHLLLPISWCGARRLSPGTLAFDDSGQFILFSVHDPVQNEGQIYQVSAKGDTVYKMFVKSNVRITSISAAQ